MAPRNPPPRPRMASSRSSVSLTSTMLGTHSTFDQILLWGGADEEYRGPEVESWFGTGEGHDPVVDYDWSLLPFMALSDGAHA